MTAGVEVTVRDGAGEGAGADGRRRDECGSGRHDGRETKVNRFPSSPVTGQPAEDGKAGINANMEYHDKVTPMISRRMAAKFSERCEEKRAALNGA